MSVSANNFLVDFKETWCKHAVGVYHSFVLFNFLPTDMVAT
jgi:hypothetical protein